jgi:hypothetical protein
MAEFAPNLLIDPLPCALGGQPINTGFRTWMLFQQLALAPEGTLPVRERVAAALRLCYRAPAQALADPMAWERLLWFYACGRGPDGLPQPEPCAPCAAPQAGVSPAASQTGVSPAASQTDVSPAASQTDASPAEPQADASPAAPQTDVSPAASQTDASPTAPQTGVSPAHGAPNGSFSPAQLPPHDGGTASAFPAPDGFSAQFTPPFSREKTPRAVYDFDQDAPLLAAAFWQTYGLDLTARDAGVLHWWAFRALLDGLPDSCRFSQIVALRGLDVSAAGGLPDVMRARCAGLQKRFALRTGGTGGTPTGALHTAGEAKSNIDALFSQAERWRAQQSLPTPQ